MTRNQIDMLRAEEEARHNMESEKIQKKELTPSYLKGIASFVSSIFGKKGIRK